VQGTDGFLLVRWRSSSAPGRAVRGSGLTARGPHLRHTFQHRVQPRLPLTLITARAKRSATGAPHHGSVLGECLRGAAPQRRRVRDGRELGKAVVGARRAGHGRGCGRCRAGGAVVGRPGPWACRRQLLCLPAAGANGSPPGTASALPCRLVYLRPRVNCWVPISCGVPS